MSAGYKLLAALVVALVLAVGGYFFGRHVRDGEFARQQLEDGLAYAGRVREVQAEVDQLSADLSATRSVKATTNRTITREITRYVQVTPAADRVLLPDDWRVRHNLAALGIATLPEAGSVAAGTAGPVEDAAALDVVGENYAACRDSADKLAGWHAWWAKVKPLIDPAQ